MSPAAQTLGTEAVVESWNATGSYFTPPPVAQQVVQSHARVVAPPPRILDLCAGAGCLAMVARQVWPEAEILGVELRGVEAPYLRRWCDRVLIGDALALRGRLADFRPDLVLGNPDYRQGVELTELALWLRARWSLLLHRGTFGDGADALALLRRHRPDLVLQIGGRPQWRPEFPSGDWIRHQWFRWSGAADGTTLDWLPALGASQLTWTERPGTQPAPPPPLSEDLLVTPPPLLAARRPCGRDRS